MDVDVFVFGYIYRYYYDIYFFYGKKVVLFNLGLLVFFRMDFLGFVVFKFFGENVGVERIMFW